jgi:hypothetical protein
VEYVQNGDIETQRKNKEGKFGNCKFINAKAEITRCAKDEKKQGARWSEVQRADARARETSAATPRTGPAEDVHVQWNHGRGYMREHLVEAADLVGAKIRVYYDEPGFSQFYVAEVIACLPQGDGTFLHKIKYDGLETATLDLCSAPTTLNEPINGCWELGTMEEDEGSDEEDSDPFDSNPFDSDEEDVDGKRLKWWEQQQELS